MIKTAESDKEKINLWNQAHDSAEGQKALGKPVASEYMWHLMGAGAGAGGAYLLARLLHRKPSRLAKALYIAAGAGLGGLMTNKILNYKPTGDEGDALSNASFTDKLRLADVVEATRKKNEAERKRQYEEDPKIKDLPQMARDAWNGSGDSTVGDLLDAGGNVSLSDVGSGIKKWLPRAAATYGLVQGWRNKGGGIDFTGYGRLERRARDLYTPSSGKTPIQLSNETVSAIQSEVPTGLGFIGRLLNLRRTMAGRLAGHAYIENQGGTPVVTSRGGLRDTAALTGAHAANALINAGLYGGATKGLIWVGDKFGNNAKQQLRNSKRRIRNASR